VNKNNDSLNQRTWPRGKALQWCRAFFMAA